MQSTQLTGKLLHNSTPTLRWRAQGIGSPKARGQKECALRVRDELQNRRYGCSSRKPIEAIALDPQLTRVAWRGNLHKHCRPSALQEPIDREPRFADAHSLNVVAASLREGLVKRASV